MWNNGKVIQGTSGNDTIDLVWQNPFDIRDNANGGDGNDTITGNAADNRLNGDGGSDIIDGGWGDDIIHGGSGDFDQLLGDLGNDKIFGDAGHDLLDGGAGNDILSGGFSNDDLFGREGDDDLGGDTANDFLSGGAGADILRDFSVDNSLPPGTFSGDDVMLGGTGNDRFISIDGNDHMDGGSGSDRFVIGNNGAHNHLLDVEIDGGPDFDVLQIDNIVNGQTFNLGTGVEAIEKIDINPDHPNTDTVLDLSINDVLHIASGNANTLTISGGAHDTLHLIGAFNGEFFASGHWVQGETISYAGVTPHSTTEFDFQFKGVDFARVIVDSAIHVDTSNPFMIDPGTFHL